jgi:hypothetical protein
MVHRGRELGFARTGNPAARDQGTRYAARKFMATHRRTCMDEASSDKGNSRRTALLCRVKEPRRVPRRVARLGEAEEESSMFCTNMCLLSASLSVTGDLWLVAWGLLT